MIALEGQEGKIPPGRWDFAGGPDSFAIGVPEAQKEADEFGRSITRWISTRPQRLLSLRDPDSKTIGATR